MNSLWKYFRICMCSPYDSWEINLKYDTLFLASTSILSQFQWNREYFSAPFLDYTWLMVDILVTWFPFAFAYPGNPVFASLFSAAISIKTMSQKFHGFWAKSFYDATKYCWYHNGRINIRSRKWWGKFVFRFSNNVAQTSSHRLKLATKIEVNYLVHFKANFHILSIFRTGSFSTFKKLIRFNSHEIQS